MTTELVAYQYNPNAQIATMSNLKAMANLDPQTLSHLLPRDAPVKRLVAEIVMAASANPMILQCTEKSIGRVLTNAALTGLHVSGPMQQAAIVPRRNKGVMEANFEVMYKGLISLAHRSDKLRGIQVGAVYANDDYAIDLINGIEHKPCVTGDRGVNVGYYTILEMKDGAKQNTFMTYAEVQAIAGRSKANAKGFSPWRTDPEQMGIKTVLKRALKNVPASTEEVALAYAIMADNESVGLEDTAIERESASDLIGTAKAEDGAELPAEYQ